MASHPTQKDPVAKIALVLGLVLLLAALYVLVSSLFNTIQRNTTKGEIDTETLVANNANMVKSVLKPVGEVATSDGSGTVAAGPARSGKEVFDAVCQACHATGAAGAPKYDDKAAWEPRVAKGFDALMQTAINGKGAMPARGGQNVPDAELKAAIAFMTKHAGFNLDIPKDKPAAPAAKTESAKENTAKATETSEAPAKAAETATAAETAKPTTEPSTEVKAPQAPTAPTTPEAPKVESEQAAPETAAAATTEASEPVQQETKAKQEATSTEATPATTEATPATTEATPATTEAAPATTEAAPATVSTEAESKPAQVADTATGEKVYKATCFACHGLGVAGAPKAGDKAAWEPHVAKGKETLYHSALNGIQGANGVMPPKGGNFKLSDDEVKAAVDYMVSLVQ